MVKLVSKKRTMRLPSAITQERGSGFSDSLEKAFRLLDLSENFTDLIRYTSYPDEPQFWKYEVKFFSKKDKKRKDPKYGGGFSWIREKAVMKALGEAIERFCLASFNEKKFKIGSYADLKKNSFALNPAEVVSFSEKQRKYLPQKYLFNENSQFKWIKGYSLSLLRPVWIPAQLVFVPYETKSEPKIRRPISTGAACWTSLAGAIYQGICELIERDAFMITYLNKLKRAKINISKRQNPLLKEICRAFKRYKLELYVVETTTDIPIPAFMAVIIDRTGVGPAVSVGLRASLNPEEAIIGAIEEAQHIRDWIRGEMAKNSYVKIVKKKTIDDSGERSILWSKTDKISKLDFLLKNSDFKNLSEIKNSSSERALGNLKTVLSFLKKTNLEVLYVDITQPEVKKAGFEVAKVIIPKLHPLYIFEPPAYRGGKRLYQVPKILGYTKEKAREEDLNEFPHPFY